MAITFECECGRQFTVGDGYAGKRTRCPSCGSALTVPAAAPEPGSEEDAAYRALVDGADPEPAPTSGQFRPERTPAAPPPAPRPTPAAPPPRPAPRPGPRFKSRSEGDGRSRWPAIYISPAVLGGAGMMVLALVWFGLGWASGRIYFYPPILFLFGLVAVVRGLLGHPED